MQPISIFPKNKNKSSSIFPRLPCRIWPLAALSAAFDPPLDQPVIFFFHKTHEILNPSDYLVSTPRIFQLPLSPLHENNPKSKGCLFCVLGPTSWKSLIHAIYFNLLNYLEAID
jgi:hypothetical protein